MIPDTGRRFGPYEILSRLGGGGMGHVYKAWDARLHREVAIKFLHNEYAMPGMRERFLREARAASALNHPNICTVFDIGEQDGDPYLVMELLEGETLKDRIDKRSVQVEEMLCLGKEVAEALGAAHAKGVIHRDVKPANIFLVAKSHSGFQSKVLDFGLAKIEGGALGARSRSLDITTVGATVGTLAYMSPEQARGEVLDSRSDLFSLGVVLYEVATRQIPFPGATSALVFVKLLNQQPEPVRDWNEAIPKDLEKVIMKLMAKERTQRYQTAHELYEALARVGERATGGWLRKAVTSQSSSTPAARPSEPLVRERRSVKRRPSDLDLPDVPPAETIEKQASRPSSDQPHFLRPVARVPTGPLRSSTEVVSPSTRALPPDPTVAGTSRPQTLPNVSAAAALPVVAGAVASSIENGPTSAGKTVAEKASAKPDTETALPQRKIRFRISPVLLAGSMVLLVVIILAAILIHNRGRFGAAILTVSDPVVLTEIENRTGDKSLDGSIFEGLQIALAQSPYLLLRSAHDYRMTRAQALDAAGAGADGVNDQIARSAAQRLGAHAYLYGSIKGATAPYTLHIDLRNTETNEVMSSAEEGAPSLQELPAAIDRVADDLRAAAGESSESISQHHNALGREGSSNLDALHVYGQAEDAASETRTLDAMRLYQQAATLDPKLTLAYLRLTTLYRKLRAEVASSDAARQAVAAAEKGSDRLRTLAQYEYEMNASGDYNRAADLIRKLVGDNPNDAEALERLARVLRMQGRLAEALQNAQQAYALDPFSAEAYAQAESALLGLDRYDAAFQMQGQEQRLGLTRPGSILVAAYLGGRPDAVDAAIASFTSHGAGYKPDWSYGLYLDSTGQLNAASQLWRRNAQAAMQLKPLSSAAAFLLSQGALDHALIGACPNALSMMRESAALPRGEVAEFNDGMAASLCGDTAAGESAIETLQRSFPQSFNVNGFYVPDIHAALALRNNDPAAALDFLKPARQYDLLSLTPFLRGRAHVALRQGQIGIVDYQTVLAHRGVTFINGSNVYAVAEIGVARAFADTGDINNSADAYRRFLELWKAADANQPLVNEARARSK